MIAALQSAAGHWPRLYVGLLALKHRNSGFRQRIVGPTTDVVVEGFPRSGTSFANRALVSVQPGDVRIATHTHHAAQVRRAAALGLPTMVVVRDPAQCIPSLYALREETRRSEPSRPPVDVARELARYARFHREVLKVRDSILLVPFEEVVDDYGRVVARLNQRFGVSFVAFQHTPENVEALFRSEGSHVSPSATRQADKEAAVRTYRQAPAELRDRAESSYRRARDAATQQALEGA